MRFFLISFFLFVFAFNMALAQNQTGGAAQSVVLESVDEDIVDDEEVASDKDASSSSESAKNNQQEEKSDDADDAESDELDIDKLLAGDDEEDLLAEDKPAVVESVPAADAVDSAAADSLIEKAEILPDSQTVPYYGGRGRGSRGRNQNVSSADYESAAADSKESDDSEPAIIEDGRSINFAHNLSEYRSPKMAMLLSFLVPGLGQAYSRNYIKAGAFGAAEVTAIGTAVFFNRSGKRRKQDAYRFANEFFSVDSLKRYYDGMEEWFKKAERDLPFGDEFYISADKKESYFYESIRGDISAPGWLDVTPNIDSLINGSYDPLLDWPLFGASLNQAKYNSMMKESKSRYDAVNYVLYVILLNHIASAVDAGFTAKAHNSNMLGKDNSVWDRISLEQQYVFTGSEMSPGIALKVKF